MNVASMQRKFLMLLSQFSAQSTFSPSQNSRELLSHLSSPMNLNQNQRQTITIRDWAQLPSELLHKIASTHLTELPDYTCFRAVCSSWRSATSKSIHLRPQQLPWLLLCSNSFPLFFSMSEQRIYNLPILDSHLEEIEEIYQSSHGQYTISLKSHGSLWLLNPLSHASIELPFPPPISEGIEEVWDVWLFGSDPALVVVMYSTRKMFFCHPGKASWKEMDVPSSYPLFNFTYHNGSFFFLNASNGATLVLNINTLQKIGQIPPPVAYSSPLVRHLVELPTGELLLLLLDESCSDSSELERLQFFMLDEQQLQWSKVSSIEDIVLFVDCNRVMAFTAGDFSGCRGNCMYFVNYIAVDNDKNKMVLLFDIGKSQVDHVPVSVDVCASELRGAVWFVPTP